MYESIFRNLIFCLLAVLFSNGVLAQSNVVIRSAHPLTLPGGGLVIIDPESSDTEARVAEVVQPTAPRAEKVDVLQGDFILYVNGKRVRSGKDLEAAYGAIKTGEEVKLGIRRGEGTLIATYKKPEPSGAGQNHMVRIGPGSAVLQGFIVSDRQGRVVVGERIPIAEDQGPALRQGDEIVSLNGKKVSSSSQVRDTFEAIPEGAQVKLEVRRSGKLTTVTFKKTSPPGRMIRRTIP